MTARRQKDLVDPGPFYGDLIDFLNTLKEQKGISLQGIADEVFWSKSSIHRIMTGHSAPRDLELVTRIARACGADDQQMLKVTELWSNRDTSGEGIPPQRPPSHDDPL